MKVINFLAITAAFLVQVTAKISKKDWHVRGTHDMDDVTGVMKHMHHIFLSHKNQSLLSAKSSSGVITSPLAQFTEIGYFSYLIYTDTTCNSNNLAISASLLLNTCSLSSNGNYTKVKWVFFYSAIYLWVYALHIHIFFHHFLNTTFRVLALRTMEQRALIE